MKRLFFFNDFLRNDRKCQSPSPTFRKKNFPEGGKMGPRGHYKGQKWVFWVRSAPTFDYQIIILNVRFGAPERHFWQAPNLYNIYYLSNGTSNCIRFYGETVFCSLFWGRVREEPKKCVSLFLGPRQVTKTGTPNGHAHNWQEHRRAQKLPGEKEGNIQNRYRDQLLMI